MYIWRADAWRLTENEDFFKFFITKNQIKTRLLVGWLLFLFLAQSFEFNIYQHKLNPSSLCALLFLRALCENLFG
jgi:hypothetical protein